MNVCTISNSLEEYLNGTRLSMNQVATRWGVSTPLLSQIKNGKKKASLELGLKILRESGASINERKRWIESQGSKCSELGKVYKDEQKERVELKLKSNVSELLESHPIMIDIFLDISLMGTTGLSWNSILKNYGEYGFQYINQLIASGIVSKKNDRYFIVHENLPHALNLENSLGMMKSVFDRLKTSAQKEEFKGEFHFDLTDVSKEGYEKLKELNKEYSKKMIKIVKENEMPRIEGGVRIISQNITSILQCFCLIFLFIGSPTLTFAQGGGLTGGGSGMLVDDLNINIEDLKRAMPKGGFPTKYPYKIRTQHFGETIELVYKPAAYATVYFSKKSDAIDSMIEMNKILQKGNLDSKEAKHIMRLLPIGRCKTHNLKQFEKRALEG
ncbi:hypothetical protein OAT67_00825 [Bacteriovoracaceae bacterium]|nr:hypothetical protein [Bacteriovoracaceae bacterium]